MYLPKIVGSPEQVALATIIMTVERARYAELANERGHLVNEEALDTALSLVTDAISWIDASQHHEVWQMLAMAIENWVRSAETDEEFSRRDGLLDEFLRPI